MEQRYQYHFDRRTRRITIGLLSVVAALFVWFHFVWGGDYLPAWMLFFVLSIITLYVLSIPRFLLLSEAMLEIHCVVDLTRIHVEDIELVRRLDREEFRRLWPLIGSYGFWGYYGYYFNFQSWTLFRVYASGRKTLVLIEDIYEDSYIVSCDDPDELVAQIQHFRDRKRAEILQLHTLKQSQKPENPEQPNSASEV
ncbi:MAG: PH domain-containing protein [Alistipes sp.]|nr:PH domain-containing protein [Alistipes sp.]